MSMSLFGWIEVNSAPRADGEGDSFHPVMDVSVIEEQCYEIYDKLFGIRGQAVAVSKNRGFPEECSKLVQTSLEGMEFVSFIYFSEMKSIMNDILEKEESKHFTGWKLILHCMDELASMYGDENVRMVVGFC